MTASAPRVAVWGFFGIGNLGNEASLDAFLAYVRRSHPDASLSCFAADADKARPRTGLLTSDLMCYRADPDRRGLRVTAAKAVGRVGDVSRTFAMVGAVDIVVVPGTGIMESRLMSSPWGAPYWLFLVALACRIRRRRLVLVSVGADRASHPITRWFHRWTVRLADRCSVRDEESRRAMLGLGVPGSQLQVLPDVVFALPGTPAKIIRRRHVALGVMAYDGTSEDEDRGTAVRAIYLERVTDLLTRLIDGGHTVTLVIGDEHDRPVAAELMQRIDGARPHLEPGSLTLSPADSFEGVMAEMAVAESVVASRFHNVVAALKVCRPVVSLGYAEKNASLMSAFGLGQFDQHIGSFDVDRVVEQMTVVQEDHASRLPVMEKTLVQFRELLEGELDMMWRTTLGGIPRLRD